MNILKWSSLDAAEKSAALQRPVIDSRAVEQAVTDIFAKSREGGS